MTSAFAREIALREERIAWLEGEVERLGNIITTQADELAKCYRDSDDHMRGDGMPSLIITTPIA